MNNTVKENNFINVFKNGEFDLPLQCDNLSYKDRLNMIFNKYKEKTNSIENVSTKITYFCDLIMQIIELYSKGKKNDAFTCFNDVYLFMQKYELIKALNSINNISNKDNEQYDLFKLICADKKSLETRKDFLEILLDSLDEVNESRYGTKEHPCLCLSTSIELCKKELDIDNNNVYYISRFEPFDSNNIQFRIIDLAIKPQDFFESKNISDEMKVSNEKKLKQPYDEKKIKQYLLLYPFIAACSFVVKEKDSLEKIEYVLPQMFMNYLKHNTNIAISGSIQFGIRFLPCIPDSSNLGFNFAFLRNHSTITDDEHSSILAKFFKITEPICINDYSSNEDLFKALNNKKADFVKL